MSFIPKSWKDGRAGGTRTDAAAMIDLEKRLSDYTDQEIASLSAVSEVTLPALSGLGVAPAGLDQATGAPAVLVSSYYGIDASGQPYYDPAGASAGEEASLSVDPVSGRLRLLSIAPTASIVDQPGWDDLAQPGVVAPQVNIGSDTTFSPVATTLYLCRFTLDEDSPVVSITLLVRTAATVDDPVDVAVLSGDLSTLIAHSGATSGRLNVANANAVAFPGPTKWLKAGTPYYAAMSVGSIGGTAAILEGRALGSTRVAGMFGPSAPKAIQLAAAGVYPIAANPAAPALITSAPFLIVNHV